MADLRKLLAGIWRAITPDEVSATASAMQFEGYTDFEIALEVQAIKDRQAGAVTDMKIDEKGHENGKVR